MTTNWKKEIKQIEEIIEAGSVASITLDYGNWVSVDDLEQLGEDYFFGSDRDGEEPELHYSEIVEIEGV